MSQPALAPAYVPTPRLTEVLCDHRLSSTSKVIYVLLDEMGRGRPVGIQQDDIASMLSLTRRTVIERLGELRRFSYIQASAHITTQGKRMMTYRTRLNPEDGSVVYH